MTMIERVTKAIQKRDIAWYVERFPEDEEAIRRAALCDLSGNYKALAVAAIEEMREPTEAMRDARFRKLGRGGQAEWEAMIDQALKDEA